MNAFLRILLVRIRDDRQSREVNWSLGFLYRCLLKHLMDPRFLREDGRELLLDDPENAILALYKVYTGT